MAFQVYSKEIPVDGKLYSLNDVENLKEILCYPREYCHDTIFYQRLRELKNIGITHVINYGRKTIGKINILGKGFSSIAVLVLQNNRQRVLKIRRIDSRRKTLEYEAILLEYLRPYSIAPRPYSWSRNYIVMDYIDGSPLDLVIKILLSKNELDKIYLILKRVLTKAWLLDIIGIDHGELNRPFNHILVDKNYYPYFIDFESARYKKKRHNLTMVSSYIFFRSSWFRELFMNNYYFRNITMLLQNYKMSSYSSIILFRLLNLLRSLLYGL
ncbi:MAG: hypothetical protein J7K21_05695 [Desulfurococcales archaeon]|nr:hypothetical protein [Desulfurococcales archaeon]